MAPIKIFHPVIPKEMRLHNEPTGTCLLRIFSLAAQQNLQPKPLARAGLQNITARLTPKHVEDIDSLKKDYPTETQGIVDGRIVGMMVQAFVDDFRKQQQQKPVASHGSWRPDQVRYYDQISPVLKQKNIALAEGATGIGKGRVMARLAYEAVLDNRGPVVVSAPSVATLVQNLSEWHTFVDGKMDVPTVGIVVGRQCFVDLDALLEILELDKLSHEAKMTALRWAETGAGKTPGSNTDPIHTFAPEVSCLLDDLLAVVPELAEHQDKFLLDNENDGPGWESYRLLQELTKDAQVKFCTHAMVALDRMISAKDVPQGTIINGALVGEYHTLLVDEAHVFETNAANVFTRSLSVFSLRAKIRKSDYGSKLGRDRAIKACDRVIALGQHKHFETLNNGELFILPTEWDKEDGYVHQLQSLGFFSALADLNTALKNISRSKKDTAPRWISEAKWALSNCPPKSRETEEQTDSDFAAERPMPRRKATLLMTVSPQKHYLSLSVGSVSIRKVLENIWLAADKGVALVSATLQLPDGAGGRSGQYSLAVLGLSQNPVLQKRIAVCLPVIPAWVTSPVTLRFPDPKTASDIAEKLKPPVQDEDDSEWLDEVADRIGHIAINATGGTLVLLTSYDRQNALRERLENQGLANRLVNQNRGGVPASLSQYRSMTRSGCRPIWLAVGSPAWMGLDMNDRDIPGLLSDLVIPRLPFGLSQGITSRWRAKTGGGINLGYPPRVAECAFAFRQGVGRLVRHAEAKGKNLWILDSRPWLAEFAGSRQQKGTYSPFLEILRAYSNQESMI
jgi:Rad3-related DNA helicase